MVANLLCHVDDITPPLSFLPLISFMSVLLNFKFIRIKSTKIVSSMLFLLEISHNCIIWITFHKPLIS